MRRERMLRGVRRVSRSAQHVHGPIVARLSGLTKAAEFESRAAARYLTNRRRNQLKRFIGPVQNGRPDSFNCQISGSPAEGAELSQLVRVGMSFARAWGQRVPETDCYLGPTRGMAAIKVASRSHIDHSVQPGKERPRSPRGVDHPLERLAVSDARLTTTSRNIIFTLRAPAQGWAARPERRSLLLVHRCPQSPHRVYTFGAQNTPWHPGGAF
jgi:hypothetical protein